MVFTFSQVNAGNSRTMFEICSDLTIKTITVFTHCSAVSVFNFDQVNASPANIHLFKVNSRNSSRSEAVT